MAKITRIRISKNAQTTQKEDDVNTFQNKIVYKPFDIVKAEKHGTWHYGMITETSGYVASVVWFEKQTDLKAAWWEKNELTVVNNAAAIIANEMAHPFGGNRKQSDLLFGIKNDAEQ